MTLGDFIHGGGPILVIIIILGLVGLFFFFERLFVLLRERNEMMATVIKVRNSIAQKNITAAKQHCRSQSYASIFSSGISLALYTTVGGLAVAIPLLILMAILREFEDRILESTTEEVRSIVVKLKSLPLEEVQ